MAITEEQKKAFQAVVLTDLLNCFPVEDWEALRTRAMRGSRDDPAQPRRMSPEELVQEALAEAAGPTIPEILAWPDEVIDLQKIDGSSVMRISDRGIYLWAPASGCGAYLSIWVSYPAYPPGW